MLTEIFKIILRLSVAAGIVALAILIIRALFWRKIPARLQYAIWALLLIRLVLPVLPSCPISIFGMAYPSQTAVAVQSVKSVTDNSAAFVPKNSGYVKQSAPAHKNTVSSYSAPDSTAAQQPAKQAFAFPFGLNYETAALLWLLGMVLVLLYFISVNIAVHTSLSKQPVCRGGAVAGILDSCRFRLGLHTPVKIICCNEAKSPATFGIFSPRIVISKDFLNSADNETLQYVFMHELTHVKRRDNALNLAVMLFEAVNWFNPVLWYAFYKMKEDCEISCDDTVLSKLDDSERRSYGYAIVNVLQTMPSRFIPGAAGFAGSFTKRRIVMIANKKKTSVIFTAIALAALMLVGVVSMPAAKVAASKQNASWIYFVSQKGGQLYRSHPDGTGKTTVSNVKTNYYAVSGNWIYYNPNNSVGLYKIRTNGTGKTKVSRLACAVLGISGNNVFISYAKGGGGSGSDNVYSISLNGKGLKKLSKNYVYADSPFIVSNGYVYFSNGGFLYRIRTDGTGEKKLTSQFGGNSSSSPDTSAQFTFFISGGSMYYLYGNGEKYCTIYKMHLDGSGKASIGIKDAFDMASVDGSIYYRSKTATGKIYKINPDGSGKTAIKSTSWTATRAFGSNVYHRFQN